MIQDLTAILVEQDIHYTPTQSNTPKSDDAETTTVFFTRRPHIDGAGYASNDRQTSAISHPLIKSKPEK